MPDYDLKAEYSRARAFVESRNKDGATFYSMREGWDAILERRAPSSAKDHPEDDYQTWEIEKALEDWLDVLVDNPTFIDVVLQSADIEKNRKARDTIRAWDASTWKHALNKNGWWDQVTAEGQIRHGIAICRLGWYPVYEPDADGKDYDEALIDMGCRFFIEDTDIYGSAWIEDSQEIDAFYYSCDVPILEAWKKYSRTQDGALVGPVVDHEGHCGWVAEPTGTEAYESDGSAKKVKIIYRDARDLTGRRCPVKGCDHPMRTIAVYVCRPDEKDYNKAELVEEVDSPFVHSSFKITAGHWHKSRNLHRKYRPLLFPLYVEGSNVNFNETLLNRSEREELEGGALYISATDIDTTKLVGETGVIEQTYKRPEVGSGEIAVLPADPKTLPSKVSPHTLERLKSSHERMEEAKPNRWLNGTAFEEAEDVTATIGLQQAQGAAKPANRALRESTATTEEIFNDIHHAIRYWDAIDPTTEHDYPAVMSGDEDLMTGETEAGSVAVMNASLLNSIRFELRFKTESETLAEQNAKYLAGKAKYDAQIYTFEDLLRSAGIRDIERQKRLLMKDRVRKLAQPMTDQMILLQLKRSFATRTGFDLFGEVPMLQQPSQETATAHPSVQGVTGRFAQPAVVQGPQGGNEPT